MRAAGVLALMAGVGFGAEVHAAQPQWCEVLLSPEKVAHPRADDSSDFIGYLGQLLESQVIGTEDLTRLQASLERGTLLNPISESKAQLSSGLLIHYEGLQDRIEKTQIDPARVLNWVRAQLFERNRFRVQRNETREQSRDLHQRMIFHRVEPGAFKMGENDQFVNVTLTKPFDLMSTPVTQWQWSLVMGENPSHFKDGERSIVLMINGQAVKVQPDHPVEMVSWNDVQTFIQKLNDLSQVDDPLLVSLIPDHKKEDQYRLPTEAEWEFVVKNRGRANGRYSFGDREKDLGEYGWFEGNSSGLTHPVADLNPLLVDGKAFYDLHGNVWEWVQDWKAELPYGENLKDPVGPESGSLRVLRGGSWDLIRQFCRSAQRNDYPSGGSFRSVGFRLLRISRE